MYRLIFLLLYFVSREAAKSIALGKIKKKVSPARAKSNNQFIKTIKYKNKRKN